MADGMYIKIQLGTMPVHMMMGKQTMISITCEEVPALLAQWKRRRPVRPKRKPLKLEAINDHRT